MGYLLDESYSMYYGGAERQMDIVSDALAGAHDVLCLVYSDGWRISRVGRRFFVSAQRPPHLTEDPVDMAVNAYRVLNALQVSAGDIYIQRGGDIYAHSVCRYAHKHSARYVFSISHPGDCDRKAIGRAFASALSTEKALKKADAVVAQGIEEQELCRRMGLESVVIPNAVVVPDQVEDHRDSPRVFWIGHPRQWKKPEVFLSIAEATPSVRFVMYCGDELPDKLRKKALEIPNLDLRGFDPYASEELGLGDVLLSTSASEGVPNTFLEAWARGAAVVSTAIDPDGIISRSGGGITGDADFEALCGQEAARLGRKGREYVKKNHALGPVVEKWKSLLESLLG